MLPSTVSQMNLETILLMGKNVKWQIYHILRTKPTAPIHTFMAIKLWELLKYIKIIVPAPLLKDTFCKSIKHLHMFKLHGNKAIGTLKTH
jgi:hypothetical protein